MSSRVNRRAFLQVAGTYLLSASLPFSARANAGPGNTVSFPQGVASGDPQPDSVMLWTRAVPRENTDVQLLLQVSTEDSFSRLVIEEAVLAQAENDYTVRALVAGLRPQQRYFYRFVASSGGVSRSGRTMTAPPDDDPVAVHLAFASCQNYEQGHMGAWSRMITEDSKQPPGQQIHFVLHLGDFIYERYRNNAGQGQRFVRSLPPFPDGASDDGYVWADSLADYRHLYKTYLSDPHLQAARARWPFICTWDDHEFSNNSFQHFSNYDDKPLAQLQRQQDAHRAWFEYIPALVPDNSEDLRIYRKLRWGKQVQLLMTDLRSYRSPPPLPIGLTGQLGLPMDAAELIEIHDGGRDYNGGSPPARLPFADGSLPNSARERAPGTMLGAAQKQWFKQELAASDANWKVWGNSLPAIPLRLDLSAIPFQGLHDGVLGEDGWSGYPGEYRELMHYLRDSAISGVVSLSGDHHAQGAGTLALDHDAENPQFVAVDFNVTGISSTPQFSGVLHAGQNDNPDFLQLVATEQDGGLQETWNMTLTQGVLASLAYANLGISSLAGLLGPNAANPGLSYIDSNSNGYGLASFDQHECRVTLVTVTPPITAAGPQGQPIQHSASFVLERWSAKQQPELTGPTFSGAPPFPYG